MRQVFLDTETTGLNPDDRIVEIGCVELVDRRYTGRTLHHYVNPQKSNHPDAVRVHGITDDFLADKPPFSAVAHELIEFVTGAEVIIHNAAFDTAFINAELTRAQRAAIHQHAAAVKCSLLMARELFPGKGNSLDALCRRLEVDNSHRELHGALLDARLLAEVYLNMTRGQELLVIEDETDQGRVLQGMAIDLSGFQLPVLLASGDELVAHEGLLLDIDKASGGRTLWRAMA
ncbi:MAG TPA: DNA polymerase III subunit epsilon [Rubrivivax sp.]|jgi:DNA polymerase-3 subunit epsilon|nr:DNA polymerase III subunit epsilon [Rubrivivax sp.]